MNSHTKHFGHASKSANRQAIKRMAAKVIAVNELHADINGRCHECETEFPCNTRAAMRAASEDWRNVVKRSKRMDGGRP